MKITILMDNETQKPGFLTEHGISFWIQTKNRENQEINILFDTGASDRFLTNAARLGIDVKANHYTLISHGHNDHGGGLSALFDRAPYSEVYLSDKAFAPHVKGEVGEKYYYAEKSIGLNSTLLKNNKKNIHLLSERKELQSNIIIETDLEEPYPRPANERLCMVEKGKMKTDDFSHEIYLIVEEEGNLYAFTGCAHRGVVNIMAMVEDKYPNRKSYSLAGGFHLKHDQNSHQADLLRDFVAKSDYTWSLITGHCTGIPQFNTIKEKLVCPVEYGYTGQEFEGVKNEI